MKFKWSKHQAKSTNEGLMSQTQAWVLPQDQGKKLKHQLRSNQKHDYYICLSSLAEEERAKQVHQQNKTRVIFWRSSERKIAEDKTQSTSRFSIMFVLHQGITLVSEQIYHYGSLPNCAQNKYFRFDT